MFKRVSDKLLNAWRLWSHRGFMVRHTLACRLFNPGKKRILFSASEWPNFTGDDVQRSLRWTSHTVDIGKIPPGGANYDLVIPISLESIKLCCEDPIIRSRNPLPIPSSEVVALCDDKAALNDRLRSSGFARYIPENTSTGQYPYILKRRHDSWSRHAFYINSPEDEQAHQDLLTTDDYIKQRWIGGRRQYVAHLLHTGGRIRAHVTMCYKMQSNEAILGLAKVENLYRCRSRHLKIFEAMLNEIGFEGLCCIDYKEQDGLPCVFEINPRFGYSLRPYFIAMLRQIRWPKPDRATVKKLQPQPSV